MNKTKAGSATLDVAALVLVGVFVTLISLFPVRNNDVWWHMAAGKVLAGGTFITEDPFMFSVPGLPWVPHAWLSALLFYGVHALAGGAGLIAVRVLLVLSTWSIIALLVRRAGVAFALAAPLVLVAVLNAHSRFIIRPHLFEYLFMAVLLWHLLSARKCTRTRFFAVPVALQVLWVNVHASFYLGPLLVLLFFLGEGVAVRYPNRFNSVAGFDRKSLPQARAVAVLILLMVAACFINPSPLEFVLQPLSAEQRELLTRYTLEWRSPFSPDMRNAPFHPYYEILLLFVTVTLLSSLRRLRPASWLMVGLFALLSLQAHRFRVEFALVTLPLMTEQLSAAPVMKAIATRLRRRVTAVMVAAVVVTVALMAVERERIDIGGTVSDRFPVQAFDFVREQEVAQRSFHSIGFGSFLIWQLYPERQSFIDGRNIDAGLYRDFLACQTSSAGFNATIRKYELDGFVIPSPERSDGGMSNVHKFLIDSEGWSLVHMDRNAYVYVKNREVAPDWLRRFRYDAYHPMTFGGARFSPRQLGELEGELRRAAESDERYARTQLDWARYLAAMNRVDEALAVVDRVLTWDAGNGEAADLRRQLRVDL